MGLKVSIITATLNSERYIAEAVRSVQRQTYPTIEYLVIDGGSSDSTLKIIEDSCGKNITVVSEPDEGIYDAFNKGVYRAGGEVIYFLNSDDYLADPQVIWDVVGVFDQNPGLAIVYGNTMVVSSRTNSHYVRGKPFAYLDLQSGDMPPHQGFFVRKDVFEQVGYFNPLYRIAGDYDFIIRCFRTFGEQSYYLNRTMAVFREGGMSTQPEQQRWMRVEQSQIIRKYYGHWNFPQGGQPSDVSGLYEIWLERLLIKGHGISSYLPKMGIQRVAVFGTMKNARYLLEDLKRESIRTLCFLDNNEHMHNQFIEGIPVFSENWLRTHGQTVDAVILSIEGDHDQRVRTRLAELVNPDQVKILSWKNMVRECENDA